MKPSHGEQQDQAPRAVANQVIFEVFFGSTVAVMLFDLLTRGSWQHVIGSGVMVVLGAGTSPRFFRWWDGLWSRHAS